MILYPSIVTDDYVPEYCTGYTTWEDHDECVKWSKPEYVPYCSHPPTQEEVESCIEETKKTREEMCLACDECHERTKGKGGCDGAFECQWCSTD